MRHWLPEDFEHPRLELVPPGHHLRPIRASDVDLDFPAVMSSRERLWSLFGEPHGWPRGSLTYEEDLADLARHETEMDLHLSFNYAMFDADESYLAGCVYIDPPDRAGADADISYWVVDSLVGTPVAAALETIVPQWIAKFWPFSNPRIIGPELTWAEWLRLPLL
jgi:RimJ/RimL family protein N-acetyltransferase